MSRQMSCALTIDAVRARTKTVTRRDPDTWTTLKAGDQVTLVEKGMGLKKGEKVVRVAEVEIVDVRIESLGRLVEVDGETALEGLGHMSSLDFAEFWATSHGWRRWWSVADSHWTRWERRYTKRGCAPFSLHQIVCRRIEWRYLEGTPC